MSDQQFTRSGNEFLAACRRADEAFGYHAVVNGLTLDPEPDRSLIRLWGYVKEKPYRQGHGYVTLMKADTAGSGRPSPWPC